MKEKAKRFAQNLYYRFRDDEVSAMGAQLTYYLILSFFPFLIFLVAAGSFMPFSSEEVVNNLGSVLPNTSRQSVRSVLDELKSNRSHALWSIGMIATVWSASRGMQAIIKALNKAYDEEEDRPFWKVKGMSVLFTVVLAVSILLTIVLLVFGEVILRELLQYILLPGWFDILWTIARFAIPLAAMAGVFSLLYKFIPNRRLKFKEVLAGALFTTFGWILASVLFSFYVNNFGHYTKTYGSIGGVIVLLIWLYLSSVIIVLGGEINATLLFDREGRTKQAGKAFSLKLPFLSKKEKDDPNRPPEVIKPLYPSENGKSRFGGTRGKDRTPAKG